MGQDHPGNESSGDLSVFFTREQIAGRVEALGEEISRDYRGRVPILVSILKSSVIFLADLMRAITIPHHLEFMAISSFGDSPDTGGAVRILKDLDMAVKGRPVILVEAIIDTGLTAGYLVRNLRTREPESLEICVLLDRRVRRLADLPLRYVGFDVPDRFLVGYGLDHRQVLRDLPYIAVMPEDSPQEQV